MSVDKALELSGWIVSRLHHLLSLLFPLLVGSVDASLHLSVEGSEFSSSSFDGIVLIVQIDLGVELNSERCLDLVTVVIDVVAGVAKLSQLSWTTVVVVMVQSMTESWGSE